MVLAILLGFACRDKPQQKAKVEQIAQETTDFLFEQSTPQIHITNVQERQLETMKTAVYELQAYYGKNLSETVSKIHLEGQDAPWKPATDNHYCIDPIEYVEENKQRQAVAKFANYCRSSATLLRETNELLYKFVKLDTCKELCDCVIESGYSMEIPKGQTCLTYCNSSSWELTCEEDPVLKKACCGAENEK